MKILNKTNLKWWGKSNKSETWVYKQDGDWWIVKPSQKVKDARPTNKIRKEEEINWKQVLLSSLFGAAIGAGVLSLLVTYLLLRDAF